MVLLDQCALSALDLQTAELTGVGVDDLTMMRGDQYLLAGVDLGPDPAGDGGLLRPAQDLPQLVQSGQVVTGVATHRGADPGIATAGLAVVAESDRRPVLVWSSTVRTPASADEPGRLRTLYGAAGLLALATNVPHGVRATMRLPLREIAP